MEHTPTLKMEDVEKSRLYFQRLEFKLDNNIKPFKTLNDKFEYRKHLDNVISASNFLDKFGERGLALLLNYGVNIQKSVVLEGCARSIFYTMASISLEDSYKINSYKAGEALKILSAFRNIVPYIEKAYEFRKVKEIESVMREIGM